MKKLFFYVFSVALFMSCSQGDEFIDEQSILEGEVMQNEITLPEPIEAYGKAVAREIRATVQKLNEMNVDYSKATKSKEFQDKFYKDWYDANPSIAKARTAGVTVPTMMSSDEFAERYNELTEIQIDFVQQIIDECGKSTSYQNLLDRLSDMKEKICSEVPEIEQERLLNVISVLYYGVKEISYLEDQGLMLRTPYNNIQFSKVKTRGENDFISPGCRKFLASIWVIAVGEPTPYGEIVASVATVVVYVGGAAVLMYEVVTCSQKVDPNREFCIEEYYKCIQAGDARSKENSGGWGYTICRRCQEDCLHYGGWYCPIPN